MCPSGVSKRFWSPSPCLVPMYFPVNTPPASGDHAVTVSPRLEPLATILAPVSRSMRLYSICKAMKGAHPRKSANVFALATSQAGMSETPA